MEPVAVASLAVATAWAGVAAATWRSGGRREAGWAAAVAVAHVAAVLRWELAPVVVAAWLAYGLSVAGGRLGSPGRRAVCAAAVAGAALWSAASVADGHPASQGQLVAAALGAGAVATVGAALRCRHASPQERRTLQWLAAAAVLVVALACLVWALNLLVGTPGELRGWLMAFLVLVPVAQALAAWDRVSGLAESALVEAVVVAGMAVLVVSVYVVVVVGLGRAPVGAERDVLASGIAAAVVVAVLSVPVRHRLTELAAGVIGRGEASAEQVMATFGARMTRAVPMDELMLQLTESLRATLATGGAELWVGGDGVLTRAVSVPRRPPARLELGEREWAVVAAARLGGPSWTSVWLPDLVGPGDAGDGSGAVNGARPGIRVAPVSHLGQLLGLVVVRRRADDQALSEDDERLLVDLARQLGLALHNVRLDSALQASMAELERRNKELQASRLRIVTAADESRRTIERNLHDGAQQHLVALAVKLGLAGQIAEDEPELLPGLLEDLRTDVQVTIRELRELAHGIYPPLLRDRGLGEALRTATNRSPLPCSITVDLPGRYPEEVETALYFCCLEALQNAGKHAGPTASVTVRVGADARVVWFTVADDGRGFDVAAVAGHGFVNMQDRLGAMGGSVRVESVVGRGTTVHGSVPALPLPAPRPRGELQPAELPQVELPQAQHSEGHA